MFWIPECLLPLCPLRYEHLGRPFLESSIDERHTNTCSSQVVSSVAHVWSRHGRQCPIHPSRASACAGTLAPCPCLLMCAYIRENDHFACLIMRVELAWGPFSLHLAGQPAGRPDSSPESSAAWRRAMVAPSAGSWLKEAIDKVLATCTWKIVSLRTPKLQRRSVEWSATVQYIVSAEEV